MFQELYHRVLNQIPNKILAVGKNYKDHVKEMGGTSFPASPVIFQKPLTSILPSYKKTLTLPKHGRPIHHEIELAVMISKKGKDIPQSQYNDYIAGFILALDLTDRDLQASFKKQSFPWDLSKGQDEFTPLSNFVPKEKVKDFNKLQLLLKVNGKIRQNDSTENMNYKIPFLIEFCSSYMTLNEGDIILTGTPSGVGPLVDGDIVEGFLLQGEEVLADIKLEVKNDSRIEISKSKL